MGSSSSKSNSDDAAKCYNKKLYFDPEADSAQGSHYYVTDGELREKLKELVDDSEKITEVRLYTHPLNNLQVTALLRNRQMVVVHREKRRRRHNSTIKVYRIRS
jgi:hypothetical protein